MRYPGYYLPFIAISLLLLLMSNKNGSQGGYTGSAGDNGNTCLSCHSGTLKQEDGWITSDIPLTGFIPGQSYTITLSATDPDAQRFGFELTAEDVTGTKMGGFSLTNASETKLIAGGKSVTHTSSGTTASGNSKTWNFNWKAPESGISEVTFYASVNAANGNNTSSGDIIYEAKASFKSSPSFIAESSAILKIYPNPSDGIISYEIPGATAGIDIMVCNQSGQIVRRIPQPGSSGSLDLTDLKAGIYYLRTGGKADDASVRLILY